MSELLSPRPYSKRDDALLLAELNVLTEHHLRGCDRYRRIFPNWKRALAIDELPFLHVSLFKHVDLATEGDGVQHQRTLRSSSTTGAAASRVRLDRTSSELQARSTLAILEDVVGPRKRPLIVLDGMRSLQRPGEVSARIAAALSLRPLATDLHFLLGDADDPRSARWNVLLGVLNAADDLLVYGFTWMLWLAWANADVPAEVRRAMEGKRITFVHSGGWKKLETLRVSRAAFDAALLRELGAGSTVVDYYGLVEQVGIIYPLCASGFRHVPRWADVLVRDPYTLQPLRGQPGQLQLLNTLPRGAPYHSVLTEDLGRIAEGPCDCGRSGQRFELLGRIPDAEVRGCAHV